MGKTLIGSKNVDQHICREDNALYLDNSKILTCGAKDYLRNRGISIVYGQRPERAAGAEDRTASSCSPCTQGVTDAAPTAAAVGSTDQSAGNPNLEAMLTSIVRALKEEHGIEDPAALEKLSLTVLERLGCPDADPDRR